MPSLQQRWNTGPWFIPKKDTQKHPPINHGWFILKPPRTTDVECKLYNSDSPRPHPTETRHHDASTTCGATSPRDLYVGKIYCEQQIAAAKQTLMLHVQICSCATAPNTEKCTCPKTDIAPDFVERLVFPWDGPILGATFNFACVSNIGNCFNFVLTLAACPSLWRPTRWRVKTLGSTKCLLFLHGEPPWSITQRTGDHAIFLSGSSVCLSEVSAAVYYNLPQTSNIFNRHLQCTKIGAYSFALAKGMEIRYPPKTHQAPLKSGIPVFWCYLKFWGDKSESKNPTVLASPNSNPNPRKAPVIKGPSKSLSMMTRAVGLILSWRNMSLRIHM